VVAAVGGTAAVGDREQAPRVVDDDTVVALVGEGVTADARSGSR